MTSFRQSLPGLLGADFDSRADESRPWLDAPQRGSLMPSIGEFRRDGSFGRSDGAAAEPARGLLNVDYVPDFGRDPVSLPLGVSMPPDSGFPQVPDRFPNARYSPDRPGWHNYYVGPTRIAPASMNLPDADVVDAHRRFAVPRYSDEVLIEDGQRYLVEDPTTGLPAGLVQVVVSGDGMEVTNKTIPGHVFHDGRIIRTIYKDNKGDWYILTHGFGNNNWPGYGNLNQQRGPLVFEEMDRKLRAHLGQKRKK